MWSVVAVQGKTVVAVTHDLSMAERMDRQIELLDGRIISDHAHPVTHAPV